MWNTTSKSVNLLDQLDFDIEARCFIKKKKFRCVKSEPDSFVISVQIMLKVEPL